MGGGGGLWCYKTLLQASFLHELLANLLLPDFVSSPVAGIGFRIRTHLWDQLGNFHSTA